MPMGLECELQRNQKILVTESLTIDSFEVCNTFNHKQPAYLTYGLQIPICEYLRIRYRSQPLSLRFWRGQKQCFLHFQGGSASF